MSKHQDILDLSVATENKKVPAGTILCIQGRLVSSLIILHSGVAELLHSDLSITNVDAQGIIANSTRVGLVKGESICGVVGLYNNQPLGHSILTMSECIVTNKPVEHSLIVQTLQQDMQLNLQVFQALIQRIESAIFLFRNYRYLWHKLASIQDSLALGADIPKVRKSNVENSRYNLNFREYADYLSILANKQNIELPHSGDNSVFSGELQSKLNLYGQYDDLRIEQMIDYPQYLFIKRILAKPARLVSALLYKDDSTISYIFPFLSNNLDQLITHNKNISNDINRLIEILYEDKGWIHELIQSSHNNQSPAFMEQIWKYSWSCHKDAIKLLRIDLSKKYSVYKKLITYRTKVNMDTEETHKAQITITPTIQKRLEKYKGLLEKIIQFSDTSVGFRDEFRGIINQLMTSKDVQSTDDRYIQIHKRFTVLYWELYEHCFLKVIDTDLKSFIPGIMLHFGLIDETMVSESELLVIDNAYSDSLAIDEPIPTMTFPYFLEKIYTGTVSPSITETGESFNDILRKQEGSGRKNKSSHDIIYSDSPEGKVRYEIRRIAPAITTALSDSKKIAPPLLSSQNIIGNLERHILNPAVCGEAVEEFHQRDYSLFYREVVVKHRFGADLVQKEVIPNIIIYPIVGTRTMLWQELDGTRRKTAARFMVPLVFMSQLKENVGHMLGNFRWELSRTIAGSKWIDPVNGGIAGAYYDYINFYKRNPRLSSDQREYIKQFIKKTRSDRERFTLDYLTWILYESEGKLRFNPVVREIFYRFVYLRKELRDRLAKKPTFSDLENKRVNKNNKELLRIRNRIKYFQKAEVSVPDEIQAYKDFLEI